ALFEGRTDANGEAYVGVASRLETVPWTVFFMFPEGDVAGPVTATFLKVFLWCGPVVLLFLIAGVYLAGRILRPVHSLTGAPPPAPAPAPPTNGASWLPASTRWPDSSKPTCGWSTSARPTSAPSWTRRPTASSHWTSAARSNH